MTAPPRCRNEPLAQAELSPGAAGVEAVVAATSFLLSEEGGAHPA
jgi:hypothetical protein